MYVFLSFLVFLIVHPFSISKNKNNDLINITLDNVSNIFIFTNVIFKRNIRNKLFFHKNKNDS